MQFSTKEAVITVGAGLVGAMWPELVKSGVLNPALINSLNVETIRDVVAPVVALGWLGSVVVEAKKGVGKWYAGMSMIATSSAVVGTVGRTVWEQSSNLVKVAEGVGLGVTVAGLTGIAISKSVEAHRAAIRDDLNYREAMSDIKFREFLDEQKRQLVEQEKKFSMSIFGKSDPEDLPLSEKTLVYGAAMEVIFHPKTAEKVVPKAIENYQKNHKGLTPGHTASVFVNERRKYEDKKTGRGG